MQVTDCTSRLQRRIAAPGAAFAFICDRHPKVHGALLWSFRKPIAALVVAGKTIGCHYAGPR